MFLKQNEIEIEADNISVSNLLEKVAEKTNKDLLPELIETGKLISGTIILLNGRNIFHLEKLDTIVSNGDNIDIFPPGGGG